MSDEKPNVILPADLRVGDIIECAIVHWGTMRVTVKVTGLTGGGDRPENSSTVCALGTLTEDFKDGSIVLEKAGTTLPVYWPNEADLTRDRDRMKLGGRPRLAMVLIERGEGDQSDDGDIVNDADVSTLDRLSKMLGALGGKHQAEGNVELRNPDVMQCDAGWSDFTCDKCDSRARWYYPKAGVFRCITHRDKSLQSAGDPPHRHETYCAWNDDPMDAHHF